MKDKEKQLEEFAEKVIQGAGVQKPSLDFTKMVLQRIETQKATSLVTTYRPLISKKIWIGIVVLTGFLFGYSFLYGGEVEILSETMNSLSEELPSWELPSIESTIEIPDSLVYGCIVLAALLAIEIPLLKRRFNI